MKKGAMEKLAAMPSDLLSTFADKTGQKEKQEKKHKEDKEKKHKDKADKKEHRARGTNREREAEPTCLHNQTTRHSQRNHGLRKRAGAMHPTAP